MVSDAQQLLQDSRAATARGEYAEALAGFLWFHDHALETDAALNGVRLSFAITYWGELAVAYAPAAEAMGGRRDLAEQRALDPELDPADRLDAFEEADAFNRELLEEHRTVEILRRLRAEGAPIAKHAGQVAIDAVIASGDTALARECLGDPDEELELLLMALAGATERFRSLRVRHFAVQVRKMADVLAAAGENDRMAEVLARAVELTPPDLRAEVLAAL
jgi:hypothetical protein